METTIERLFNTESAMRELAKEELKLEITELICRLMYENNLSRTEMARKLGKSKSAISRALDGDRNLTLSSISDMLFVLGKRLEAQARDPAEAPCKRFIRLRVQQSDSATMANTIEPSSPIKFRRVAA